MSVRFQHEQTDLQTSDQCHSKFLCRVGWKVFLVGCDMKGQVTQSWEQNDVIFVTHMQHLRANFVSLDGALSPGVFCQWWSMLQHAITARTGPHLSVGTFRATLEDFLCRASR